MKTRYNNTDRPGGLSVTGDAGKDYCLTTRLGRRYWNVGISWLMLLCLLAGCTKELGTDSLRRKKEQEVHFSLVLPGMGNSSTRALLPQQEGEVETADVYVFDQTGILVDIGYGHSFTETNTSEGTIKTFSVTLQSGDDREVMVLVNARRAVSEAYTGGVPLDGSIQRTDFIQKITLSLGADARWITDPANPGYRAIPMWGARKQVKIDSQIPMTGSEAISISRMVARVSVKSSLDASIFTLSSVHLYNYQPSGRVIPDAGPQGENDWYVSQPYAEVPSLIANQDVTEGPISFTDPSEIAAGLDGSLYLFEAAAGTRETFQKNTCLVVGGTYQGETYYYRIDFAKKSNGNISYLPILRNYNYMVNIKSVGGPGFRNKEDALNSLPVNIEAYVLDWKDSEMDGVDFDGQHFLQVSPLEQEFWSDGAGTTQIQITTDHPEGWSYQITDSPNPGGSPVTWLTSDSPPGQVDQFHFEIQGTTSTSRTAYIHITAGRLTVVSTIVQHPWLIDDVYLDLTGFIPPPGDIRTVIAEGFFNDIKIQARDMETHTILSENVIPGTSGIGIATSSATLALPELGWNPNGRDMPRWKTVAFEYFHQREKSWNIIRTDDQSSYHVQLETDHDDGLEIPHAGGEVEITATGYFPELSIQAIGEDVSVMKVMPAAEDESTVTLQIPLNATNTIRSIDLQYKAPGDNDWTTFATLNQLKGRSFLSTGAMVAEEDAKTLGLTGNEKMNWTVAMGISHTYLSKLYCTTGGAMLNENYTPDVESGCGAYFEPDFPQLKWRLPTRVELSEMYTRRDLIPRNVSYWSSSEVSGSNNLDKAYGLYSTTYTISGKTGLLNVRCVYGPHE